MKSTLCPFCMSEVRNETCPNCGKEIHYNGYPGHLPVGYTLSGRSAYVLGASLGQGGFGITYIAMDASTSQRVAVKEYYPSHCCVRENSTTVFPGYGQEETFSKGKQHFLLEAQMLQSLSDLNSVVKVLDYFEANNSAYLVMEYLDGLSLKDHVEKNSKLPAQKFLNQLKPLMADMEKMHQRGVVHRDIAPDNIILLPDGRLKLIDFGAARSYIGDKSMTVVVKKGFAPVEQYMRKGSNASTDVYALAATIYYCITGIIPPDSAERQYGEAILTAPTSLGIHLSREQERGLEKALEIQPRDRIQSVAELAKALAQLPKPEKPKPAPKKEKMPKPQTIAEPKAEPKKKVSWVIPAAAIVLICAAAGMLLMGTLSTEIVPSQISIQETMPENVLPEDIVNVLAEIGATNATQKTFWGQSVYDRRDVVTISFVYTLKDAPQNAVDVSYAKDGSILAWMTEGNLTVASNGRIALNPNSSNMFYDFVNLKYIDFGEYLDTSLVNDMSWMFCNCKSLHELDLSSFDTTNVTDMNGMFANCKNLSDLDLSSFDTSGVANMSELFSHCEKLQSLDLSAFDTSSVTDMSHMFAYCNSLQTLTLDSLDTSMVTNMNSMFRNCSYMTSLDLSGFDTSNVADIGSMFAYCSRLEHLILNNFDTSNITSMNAAFSHCINLPELDISSFNTENVTDMAYMFFGCRKLKELNLNHFKYSSVTTMNYMFADCIALEKLYMKGFVRNRKDVTNLGIFDNCRAGIVK